MREDQLRKYAAELGIVNFRPKTANGWMETNCPLAPWTHPSGADRGASFALMVNNEGRSWARCLACGHSSSFAGLAFRLYGHSGDIHCQEIGREIEQIETQTMSDNLPDWDDVYEEPERVIHRQFLDAVHQFRQYPPAFYYARCQQYLLNRGIRPTTALLMNLRYHYAEDRIMFPVYDRNMELRGFSGRAMYTSDDPGYLKVKDYAGLNKEELLLGEHYIFAHRLRYRFVVVVEGLMDRAAVWQAGFPNSVALMGNQLTKHKFEKLIDLNMPIVWFVDNDEGGRSLLYGPMDKETEERDELKSAIKRLGGFFPQMVVRYPKGNKKSDPGSLSSARIRQMVRDAEVIF